MDGVTSAPLGAAALEEQEDVHEAAIPMAPSAPSVQKTSKNDDIKMWAVSVSLARYHLVMCVPFVLNKNTFPFFFFRNWMLKRRRKRAHWESETLPFSLLANLTKLQCKRLMCCPLWDMLSKERASN